MNPFPMPFFVPGKLLNTLIIFPCAFTITVLPFNVYLICNPYLPIASVEAPSLTIFKMSDDLNPRVII